MEMFREVAKKHGFSPSYTRMRIFDYLSHAEDHPSIDDIYSNLKPDLPTLSKTTVYNVVNLFVEKKIVSSLKSDLNETRYEINHRPHAHFICCECGKVYDIDEYDLHVSDESFNGFKVQNQEVVIKGICPLCNK